MARRPSRRGLLRGRSFSARISRHAVHRQSGHCRVNHDRIEWQGSTPKAIEQPDFIRCDDPWFRPVDIELGPDGALYIADFYNRIIGHYEVPLEHPGRDRERGRIWRVIYGGLDGKTSPPVMPELSQANFEKLVELLGHPNLTARTHATNKLATMALAESDFARLQELVLAAKGNPWQQAQCSMGAGAG